MDGKSDNNKVMLEGKIVAPLNFRWNIREKLFTGQYCR